MLSCDPERNWSRIRESFFDQFDEDGVADTVQSIETARYRFTASMADLERCYDEEAGRLRAAFVAEVAALYQSEAA